MGAIKDIETCFNYCSREAGYFSSNEQRWITRILRLEKQFPELVTVLKKPEENDGVIYARLPVTFLRLQGPAKISEETIQASRARLAEIRDKKRAEEAG